MKIFTTIMMTFCLCLMVAGQDYQPIPIEDAMAVANRNAAALWGDVYPAAPIAYYGADGQVIAWRMNYAIGKPFPEKAALIEACASYRDAGDAWHQWGGDDYGRILIGARDNLPVLLEYAKCLSAEYALGEQLAQLARTALDAAPIEEERIYYLNHFDTWHRITDGQKVRYICTAPTGGILDEAAFEAIKITSTDFCKTGDFKTLWRQYLEGFVAETRADKYIPDHIYMPFYDWSYGCSPTAAAMLFAWYDYRSAVSSDKFPYFVVWHYERWDNCENEQDYNVSNLQRDLALAMNTDTMTGSTMSYNLDNGMRYVANSQRGYDFSVENFYTFLWTRTKNDIDDGRPLIVSIPGHSTTGVGYNDATDMAITHYTHDPPNHLVWVSRWSIDMTTRAVRGGQKGSHVRLIVPRGDPNYNHDGEGEVYHQDNWAEITWESDMVPDAWIDLFYSTDGGYNMEPLATGIANTGIYNWNIPAGLTTTHGRVMINLHDPGMEPYIAGADGSYGNFIINSGGAIATMNDGHLYENEQAAKFYHLQHSLPSWYVVGSHTDSLNCHWQLQLFGSTDFHQDPIHEFAYGRNTNFIVIDGNHAPDVVRGIKHRPYGCSKTNFIQYEGGNDELTLMPGASMQINWTGDKIVEMFDIHLTPGQYFFRARRSFGDVDADIAFFSSGSGNYIRDISQADYISENWGSAEDAFIVDIDTEDDYGFCIYAKTRGSGTLNLKIDEAFIWTGDEDNNWHNPDNWLAGTVPNATSDVAIPGTAHDPEISSADAGCHKLSILNGGSLTVAANDLIVSGDMYIDDNLYVLGAGSIIACYGNVTVAPHAYIEHGPTAATWVYGDWTFEEGSHPAMTTGTIKFKGTENAIIYVKSDEAWFNNLEINKTGGAWVAYDNCPGLRPLRIKGQFIIDDQAKFIQYALYNTIFEGPFLAYSGSAFMFTNGSAIFDYSGTGGIVIHSEPGSYFNNLTASCADWLGLTSDIEIRGDLLIEEGNFKTLGYDVYVRGDWNDQAWGFNHGSSRVIFNGSGIQESFGGAFWELELDKPGGELRIRENTTGVQHYDWTQGTLRVNGGFFLANDLEDPGLYGNIILTEGNIEIHQDEEQFLDMNAHLEISGGEMELQGGNGTGYWPYSADASITMTDGVLTIGENGIRIYNSSSYSLDENISGGTIRIGGGLGIYRDDFKPTGGTIEFFGYEEDATLYSIASSNLFNLVVNKSSKDRAIASTLTASGTIDVNGDFTIEGGNFEAPPVMKIAGQYINLGNQYSFDERSGNLIFDGPDDNVIDQPETFYDLTIQKPSGFFLVDNGVSLDITGTLTVDEGLAGFLAGTDLSLGQALAVNYGGTIVFEGSASDPIYVNSGITKTPYAFDINGGGTIGAIHTIFTYMGTNGINIHSGAYVMPEGAFHHCNFAYGMAGGTLMTIDNGADLVVEDAYFLPNTTGMAYNITKNVDNGNVYFDGATGDFSGPDFENDPYNRIHWEYIPPFVLPFAEDWSSGSLDTQLWTATGANWSIDTYYGNDAPSARFRYTPQVTNYSQQLRSYLIDGTSRASFTLGYDIAYDEYLPGTLEQLSVRVVYPNGDFHTVANYTNASGSFDFISESIDISEFAAGEEFMISFVAHGEDSWNINKWNIDNILVDQSVPPPGWVDGFVYDLSSTANIENAKVSIQGTSFETYTDATGYYLLGPISPGAYQMDFTATGYLPVLGKPFTIDSGDTTHLTMGLNPLPPQYCTANLYSNGCAEGDGVNTFVLEDIVNENSGCSPGGYGDFTSMNTLLNPGYPYPLQLMSNYADQHVSVWIDLDDDIDFSESERLITDFILADAGTLYEAVLDVPGDAPEGEHRLRVRTNWNQSSAEPCDTYNYGEAEDYTVTIGSNPATGGLKILVTDGNNKGPVENARVELLGTNWFGYTETEGYCIIDLVVPGMYDVLITHSSYQDLILTGRWIFPGRTTEMEAVLSPAQPQVHNISLKTGWQGLSSHLVPENNYIPAIFQPIFSSLTLVYNFDEMYWPSAGIYTLQNWAPHDGFIIHVNQDVLLAISGWPETNLSCDMPQGWSILPVVCPDNVPVTDLMNASPGSDNVVIIKEIAGTGVYWPAFGINSLGALKTGCAYQLLMDQNGEICYPEASGKSAPSIARWSCPETGLWNVPDETPVSHVMALPGAAIQLAGIDREMILAAFTQEGICCGMAPLTGNTAITLFGDDPSTFQKEGYAEAESMRFALINPDLLSEKSVEIGFDPTLPDNDGLFHANGLSAVKTLEVAQGIPGSIHERDILVYPNPTRDVLKLEGLQGRTRIVVFDGDGQKLREEIISGNRAELGFKGLDKGIYILQLISARGTVIRRVVLM